MKTTAPKQVITPRNAGTLSAERWDPASGGRSATTLIRLMEYGYEFAVEQDQSALGLPLVLVLNDKFNNSQVRRVYAGWFIIFNDKTKAITSILTETEFHDLYEFAPMAAHEMEERAG